MTALDDLLDDGYDIFEALEMLIADNHPDLHEALREAIDDHDRRVRVYAALRLAELFQDVDALPGLYEALHDRDRRTSKRAADLIWEIGDSDAPGLIRALHFERAEVQQAISGALDAVGWFPDDVENEVGYRIATRGWREIVAIGAAAVPGLVSALSDPDGNVRRGSAWALGQIGDARAVPYLIERLDDMAGDMFGIGERVCDTAAEALERIGTPEALEAVEAWRGESPPP